MPNDYFRFKQFTVRQDRCAMKVTADACVFGAWAPVPDGARRALDFGCGTGLLSLMLAQRFPDLRIDAVDIDQAAAEQAAENVRSSPFSDRIRVWCGDGLDAGTDSRFDTGYDYLICNPPFFTRGLENPDEKKRRARHDLTLSLKTLAAVLPKLLSPIGRAAVLIPQGRFTSWGRAAFSAGYVPEQTLLFAATAESKKPRAAVVVQLKDGESVLAKQTIGRKLTDGIHSLYLRDDDGVLDTGVAAMLQPFYLSL